jgi:8-oxo-dGTP diphosphatase
MPKPVSCVGVVCWRGDEVLLIKRGRAPRLGEWSIPGGKIEAGESLHAAARRELFEETGVTAEIGSLIEVYEILLPGVHYILIDYAARWLSGDPRPGDDADEACFLPLDEALSRVRQADTRDVLMRSRQAGIFS